MNNGETVIAYPFVRGEKERNSEMSNTNNDEVKSIGCD